ncbi:MAG TPA: ECF-type sigma factor [Gemmataceae bacterium]|nr:ECF-type sigma factor [Gemmataceae bacterium]
MTEVTRILSAIEQGDPQAAQQLLPLVYDELRKLAAAQMAREKPGQTLDATGLVHEAYMRLVGDQHFESRRHFFAAAAEAMRCILVDRARRKGSRKRGGGRTRVPLDETDLAAAQDADEVLAVNEALAGLAAADAQAAELVKLRYFAGLSIPDAAQVLNIGHRSADRLWAYARAWLRRAIGEP